MIQRKNAAKQNLSKKLTHDKNNNKLTCLDASITTRITTPTHVHMAIPEWIDKTDSDTDKDNIVDDTTMSIANNNNISNSRKTEFNVNLVDNDVAVNTIINNS